MNKATLAVHAGTRRELNFGGLNTPIFTSSAIEYLDDSEVRYPRYFNTHNSLVVAEKIAALEHAEAAIVTSSGMAAISTVILGLLQPGDHVIFLEGLYGGTHAMVSTELERLGMTCSFVGADPEDFRKALRPETRMLYIESPTNPLLTVLDLRAIAGIAAEHGAWSVIDGTFATPVLQNPVDHGFDLVVHSGTKYLGGHSDLCCGAITGSGELIERLRGHALMHGGSLNAQDCALLERSLKTLDLRVRRQSANARTLAEALDAHGRIERVYYPGLASHPGHEIAAGQMDDFGAMLSFDLAADVDPVRFLRALRLIACAVSLGGVETTVCQPVATSHQKMPAAERERLGIRDALIRLSTGIEDPQDLIDDLEQALAAAA
ncbi:trans-sulfuration enzyme family protein [Elongatibacter sediminis]|uniref:Aminotransferase class I/II-fold pyridoxal phosphate-dependent enzyme n=1 Tax=Elongatibacter sediminis TaxID=3119006 RepID=A0AAW9RIX1_9GAMM